MIFEGPGAARRPRVFFSVVPAAFVESFMFSLIRDLRVPNSGHAEDCPWSSKFDGEDVISGVSTNTWSLALDAGLEDEDSMVGVEAGVMEV